MPPNLPASFLVPTVFDEFKQASTVNVANDGFLPILTTVSNVYIAAYHIPIANLFAALDALRTDVLARSAANDPGFMWNLPFDVQFLRVTDDAVL